MMTEIERDLPNETHTVKASEDDMSKFHRYNRLWYTTKKEAQDARRSDEQMYFDEGMEAYYLIRPKKSIWDF